MNWIKKVLPVFPAAFIAIQFIQPTLNKNGQDLHINFEEVLTVPENIQSVLHNACYDCHSNNTTYPWYSNVQPVGWMLANHIKQGKEKLNFSEFENYGSHRQVSKLEGIANQINDNKMPIPSYKLMHKNARLTFAEKTLLINWMNHQADSLSAIN